MNEFHYTKGPLNIWGINEKTEIGGFTMIGPQDDRQQGCTAYVCNKHDAILYAAAPDLLYALHQIASRSRVGIIKKIAKDAINKAKGI